MLELIKPQWAAPSHIVAYTTTRRGGLSKDGYSSLNVGDHVGDAPDLVTKNRQKLPFADRICWLRQVHGCEVAELNARVNSLVADAAVSGQSDFFCAVMTADCVPILLCDEEGKQVAAIHAGWQGLLKGVITTTINAMASPPSRLYAWIGPAICQRCYEVDKSLAEHFNHWPAAVHTETGHGKAHLNLPLIAQLQLTELGITRIINSQMCTYCHDTLFFSHRRAQHHNCRSTGRMVSAIGIADDHLND